MRYEVAASFYNRYGLVSNVIWPAEADDPDGALDVAQPAFERLAWEQGVEFRIFRISRTRVENGNHH